jgi:hypothetical protein
MVVHLSSHQESIDDEPSTLVSLAASSHSSPPPTKSTKSASTPSHEAPVDGRAIARGHRLVTTLPFSRS